MGEERTGRNLGRTMKELREAKGFTHKDLAARINDTLKKWLESALPCYEFTYKRRTSEHKPS